MTATKKRSPNGHTLIFDVPGPNVPGYLRRIRQARLFVEKSQERTVESLEAEIEFILQYVSEPADREAAREILLDATQEQYIQFHRALMGELTGSNPT